VARYDQQCVTDPRSDTRQTLSHIVTHVTDTHIVTHVTDTHIVTHVTNTHIVLHMQTLSHSDTCDRHCLT